MKIVIADPIFLTEEYKARLEALGVLEVYDNVPWSMEEFLKRVKDAEIVVVGRYGFKAEAFHSAPKLEMISLWQTGCDNVDLEAATEHNVLVSNVPNYAFDSVAEFVFVLALNLLRKTCTADSMLRDPSSRQLYCPLIFRKACTVDPMLVKGRFDWRYYLGNELMGKTLGVIGTGSIGKRVIQIAHGFNMNILSTTAHPSPEREKKLEVKFVDIDTMLSECDILTLHLPLTKETEHMIGASQLAKMKPTAVLINTARGKLIDEEALVDAIRGRKIAGAGLDVFENEPLPINSPLLDLDNVILTPHIAFLTEESIDECTCICIENVETFLSGKPQNVVNPEVLAS